MIDPHFVYAGALISFSGGLSYLVATLRGRVQPNRVTWFLWSLAPLIAFAAEARQGVGLPALMTFMVGFSPLLVFLASFVSRTAQWPVGRFDLLCGLLSLSGLVLWLVTKVGDIAILFSILADALAAVPTLTKAFRRPESENAYAFAAMAAGAAITLLTVNVWNFATYGFPLYILAICTVLAVLIRFRPGKLLQSS